MAVPPEVAAYATDVGRAISATPGVHLFALYLHGSAAMGGWQATRSDVDLLAVVQPANAEWKLNVADALGRQLVAPGTGVEFSAVALGTLLPISASPPFELHVATGPDAKVVDGAGRAGDPDLVLHFAVCRERGVTVAGAPAKSVLPAVPETILHTALAGELRWAAQHAAPAYAVLNAARALAYVRGEGLLSKEEGAEWALGRSIEPELLGEALASQRGDGHGPGPGRVNEFLVRVIAELESHLTPGGG